MSVCPKSDKSASKPDEPASAQSGKRRVSDWPPTAGALYRPGLAVAGGWGVMGPECGLITSSHLFSPFALTADLLVGCHGLAPRADDRSPRLAHQHPQATVSARREANWLRASKPNSRAPRSVEAPQHRVCTSETLGPAGRPLRRI